MRLPRASSYRYLALLFLAVAVGALVAIHQRAGEPGAHDAGQPGDDTGAGETSGVPEEAFRGLPRIQGLPGLPPPPGILPDPTTVPGPTIPMGDLPSCVEAMADAASFQLVGRFEGAVVFAKAAAQACPDLAEARVQLGVLQLLAQQSDDAVGTLREVYDRGPLADQALVVMGVWSLFIGDVEAGRANLEEALELSPHQWRARVGLAALLGAAEHAAHLATHLPREVAHEQDLDLLDMVHLVGELLDRANARLKGGCIPCLRTLADIQVDLASARGPARDRWRRAARYLSVAVDARPEDVMLRQLLAKALAQAGDDDGMIAVLAEGVRRGLDGFEPLLGKALLDADRTDEALAHLEAARASDRAPYWSWLGDAYRRAGRNQDAEAAYRKALALAPSRTQDMVHLGQVLASMGHPQEAATMFQRALERDTPLAREAHYGLSMALKTTEPNEAKAHLETYRRLLEEFQEDLARQEQAGHRAAGLENGLGLLRAGDLERARTELERYLSVHPDDAVAHLAIAGLVSGKDRSEHLRSAIQGLRRIDSFIHPIPGTEEQPETEPAHPRRPEAKASDSANPGTEPTQGVTSPALPRPRAPGGIRFEDVTRESMVDFVHETGGSGRLYYVEPHSGGAALADFDGDGHLDLYLVDGGALPGSKIRVRKGNRLYKGKGDGTFLAVDAGVRGTAYGMGAYVGDFDSDGDPDIYVTQFDSNDVLYRNEGGMVFTDVTVRAGIHAGGWSTGATWLDADRDGDLDLYVVRYLDYTPARHKPCYYKGKQYNCSPYDYPGLGDLFFRNLGGGRLGAEDVGVGDPSAKGLGVIALDYDRDGWQDLYVANDETPNLLYHNLGGRSFEDLGLLQGVAVNPSGAVQAGMGLDVGDVDRDGLDDLVCTNFQKEPNNLFIARPDGTYQDEAAARGWDEVSRDKLCFAVLLDDYDLDGDLDAFIACGHVWQNAMSIMPGVSYPQTNLLLVNDGTGHFSDGSAAAGPAFTRKEVSRAAVSGDIDEDGDLDVVYLNLEQPAVILRNTSPRGGHWLSVRLQDDGANTEGIGARILVRTPGGTWSRELRRVRGFFSSSPAVVHLGLGQVGEIQEVVVRWPDANGPEVTRVSGVPLDSRILIHRRTGRFEVLP